MKIKEKFSRKLLVEGNDDQHVIWAICQKLGVIETFDVIDCGSINEVFKQLPVRFKQADVSTIGILIDADENIEDRWNKIQAILIGQGFVLPNKMPLNGLITFNETNQKVGVWIMPKNDTSGMLEDFISYLIPENDLLLPKVKATLENIEEEKLNNYNLIHKSKAIIHTWLAWQEDPGTPMGLAITKKYLQTESEICLRFVCWLKELFSDSINV